MRLKQGAHRRFFGVLFRVAAVDVNARIAIRARAGTILHTGEWFDAIIALELPMAWVDICRVVSEREDLRTALAELGLTVPDSPRSKNRRTHMLLTRESGQKIVIGARNNPLVLTVSGLGTDYVDFAVEYPS